MGMEQDILRPLVTEEELQQRVKEIGAQITADYQGKRLLLLGVLKGSIVFMSDIMRQIDLPCRIDFMSVSSYGDGTNSSGVVKILKDLDMPIKEYDVLIIEDILDSGRTLSYLKRILQERSPRSIRICTLLDKPDRRVVDDVNPEYKGFVIPDEFVVGYGLDYGETYRNLPYIALLKEEVYRS